MRDEFGSQEFNIPAYVVNYLFISFFPSNLIKLATDIIST